MDAGSAKEPTNSNRLFAGVVLFAARLLALFRVARIQVSKRLAWRSAAPARVQLPSRLKANPIKAARSRRCGSLRHSFFANGTPTLREQCSGRRARKSEMRPDRARRQINHRRPPWIWPGESISLVRGVFLVSLVR